LSTSTLPRCASSGRNEGAKSTLLLRALSMMRSAPDLAVCVCVCTSSELVIRRGSGDADVQGSYHVTLVTCQGATMAQQHCKAPAWQHMTLHAQCGVHVRASSCTPCMPEPRLNQALQLCKKLWRTGPRRRNAHGRSPAPSHVTATESWGPWRSAEPAARTGSHAGRNLDGRHVQKSCPAPAVCKPVGDKASTTADSEHGRAGRAARAGQALGPHRIRAGRKKH